MLSLALSPFLAFPLFSIFSVLLFVMVYGFGCARNESVSIKMVAYLIHVEFTAAKYKFTAFLFSMYTILDLQWLQRTWGYLDLKTPTDTNETPTHSDHLTVTMKLHLTRTRIDFLISLINENGNPWLGTMCIVRSNSNSRFMFVRATVGVCEGERLHEK